MKDKRQESNNCIKVCLFSFFKKKTTPSAEKNVHTSIPNIKKKKRNTAHLLAFSKKCVILVSLKYVLLYSKKL